MGPCNASSQKAAHPSLLSRRSFIRLGIASCAAASLMGTACSRNVNDGKPVIYASFFPIYDLVRKIAGDTAQVLPFMTLGNDPHLWEPTPRSMKELSQGEFLVINGANMERWIDQVRDAIPQLEVLTLSDSVELITYKGAASEGDFQYLAQLPEHITQFGIEFGHTHENSMRIALVNNTKNLKDKQLIALCKKAMEGKAPLLGQRTTTHLEDSKVYAIEMGHTSGHVDFILPNEGNWIFVCDRISEHLLPYQLVDQNGEELKETVLMDSASSGLDKITYDPHSWISIKNAKRYCAAIHDELLRRWPDNERIYRKNKLALVDSLTDLEVEYKEKFKQTRIKAFVTSHYAYEYLAQNFGLQQFPLQGLTSIEAPSLKTIKKAIDFCRYHKITTIFYEYGSETKNAQTIASEMGGRILPLSSMEYANGKEKDGEYGYLDYMKLNLENLYQSML